MTETKRPRGRPPKYPPEEVRARLIESAIKALSEEGVESGLDAVGLDAAIADADVPRGMSYRIWQDSDRTPQDALRHGVVLELLRLPTTKGLDATRERLAVALTEAAPHLSSGDRHARKQVVTELIRVIGSFNHEALDSSDEWRLYNALRSAAITRSDLDPEVLALLQQGEDLLISEYATLYRELANALGLHLREGLTIEQFTAAAYALNEGLSARLSNTYQRSGIRRHDDGGEWTLFSIALEGLIHQFFDF